MFVGNRLSGRLLDVPMRKWPGVRSSGTKSLGLELIGDNGRDFSTASICTTNLRHSSRYIYTLPIIFLRWSFTTLKPVSHNPPRCGARVGSLSIVLRYCINSFRYPMKFEPFLLYIAADTPHLATNLFNAAMQAPVAMLETISRWRAFVTSQTNNDKQTFLVVLRVLFILTMNGPAKSIPVFVNGHHSVIFSAGRGPIGSWNDVWENRAHVVQAWMMPRRILHGFRNQKCWRRLHRVDCSPEWRHCWWYRTLWSVISHQLEMGVQHYHRVLIVIHHHPPSMNGLGPMN